jgi:hypothetical protein
METERKEIDDILRDPLKEVLSLLSTGNLLQGIKSAMSEESAKIQG